MRSEPVLTVISGLVMASLALLAAFGLDFTTEQIGAIGTFVAALYAAALLIRAKVSPVSDRETVKARVKKSRR